MDGVPHEFCVRFLLAVALDAGTFRNLFQAIKLGFIESQIDLMSCHFLPLFSGDYLGTTPIFSNFYRSTRIHTNVVTSFRLSSKL